MQKGTSGDMRIINLVMFTTLVTWVGLTFVYQSLEKEAHRAQRLGELWYRDSMYELNSLKNFEHEDDQCGPFDAHCSIQSVTGFLEI